MSHATPLVFVFVDQTDAREAVAALTRGAGWETETFASAHAFLVRPHVSGPRCLVLDVSAPSIDGLALQRRLAVEQPDVSIVFLADGCDVAVAVRAMKAGAVEVLVRPFDDDALVTAVACAIERSRSTLRRSAEVRALEDGYASLSRREREVLALVASGRRNKQVGGVLGISEITVKAHRGQVMRKMHADSLAHLVTMASRLGVAPAAGRLDGVRL